MEPVFAAAAIPPLTSINSKIGFEPVPFSRKLLELAEAGKVAKEDAASSVEACRGNMNAQGRRTAIHRFSIDACE
jgi:hypothetical protein